MLYSIGEIAKITRISKDRLRNYEKIGILNPIRETENKYRKYTEHDIDRVLAIELYRAAEISLMDIKSICLDCSIERLDDILHKKRDSIEEQLYHLQLVKDRIEELIGACSTIQENLDKISISEMVPFDVVGEMEDYRSYGDYQKLFEHKNCEEQPILYKMQRKLLFDQRGIYENKMILTKHSTKVEENELQKCIYTVVKDGEGVDPMKATFEKCIEFCRTNGLTPTGEVYIGMLLIYCNDGSIASYLEIRGPIK